MLALMRQGAKDLEEMKEKKRLGAMEPACAGRIRGQIDWLGGMRA